jgi:hypothetical protein
MGYLKYQGSVIEQKKGPALRMERRTGCFERDLSDFYQYRDMHDEGTRGTEAQSMTSTARIIGRFERRNHAALGMWYFAPEPWKTQLAVSNLPQFDLVSEITVYA